MKKLNLFSVVVGVLSYFIVTRLGFTLNTIEYWCVALSLLISLHILRSFLKE